jgi:predicted AAA+ superfamily ATPase
MPSKKDILGGDKSIRMLLAANSGSGKTSLVKNMLT